MSNNLTAALRTPRDMDLYLELHSADQIIADIKTQLSLNAFGTAPAEEGEIIGELVTACGGVPYLATCIYETLKRAGLTIVRKKDKAK